MKIKILEDKKNPFLKRREVLVHVDHEGEATPSMAALEQFLIKDLKADPEKIEILNIYSARGAATAKSQVHIWDEKKVVKKKKKVEEKPKKEAKAEKKKAPKEERGEEKPGEETKEAKKEEPKPEKPKEEIKKEPAQPEIKKGEKKE